MKDLVRITILLIILLTPPLLHANNGKSKSKIRVGVFQLSPFNYIDNEGKAQGLYPDLLREIAREEQWNLEFVHGTWSEGLKRLQDEEIDLVTTIASSPERARTMDFTLEPVSDMWGQVFLPPNNTIDTIADLEGQRVAAMTQDISGQNFIETIKKLGISCTILFLPTHADVFKAVQEGEVVAGISTQHFGLRHADDFELIASPIQFSPFAIYFAAKKNHLGTVLSRIDAHMSRWKKTKDSFYYKRFSYWMGAKEFEKEILPTWLLIAVGVIASVVALLTYVNWALNRKVKKRTRELRTREKQYRELVESANSIILRLDKYGRVLFLNRFGLDLFGYTRKEIIGQNVVGTILTPDEAKAQHFKVAGKETFELSSMHNLIENANRCKDGRQVFIQWSNRAIHDDEGQFQEILSIGTDITQRRQLEASLYQAQKMEAIGTLAGGIAHDFNNILAVIFGYTELAQLHVENPTKVKEALDQLSQGATRAKELVSQILTFSRKSDSKKQPLQPALIIKETVKLLRPSLPATITLETSLASSGTIKADPVQIHQIIMNLCTNAFHAMEDTGGTLRISLEEPPFSPSGRGVLLLEISDTGCGIAPEATRKIFDPYFTTKEKGKGTGLGLSVVHGIVKGHSGHIHVHSTLGQGSTFQVSFPLLPPHTAPLSEPSREEEITGGDETLLLVDDEKEITSALADILMRYGYNVLPFVDGAEALKRFIDSPESIDLVITDMTMPGMAGPALAKHLLARRPSLPIILCTGYSELMATDTFRQIGIAECLQKPVMSTTLLQRVRHLLDARLPASQHPSPSKLRFLPPCKKSIAK